MYLFSVDFSKNNLLTEQININSLYNLPVMNKLLIEQQLINFADLPIKKAFMLDYQQNIDFSIFDTVSVKEKELFRELALIDDCEQFFAFRNDVYFETDELRFEICEEDCIVLFNEADGIAIGVSGSVGILKKFYNKNISLSEFLKSPEKFNSCYKEIKDGYVNHLKSIKKYKSLLSDILKGRTFRRPPFVAEGVFTDGEVPEGDFSIVPPVYIGEAVQIESGSVIGPDTVIYNNSLIAENTSVKDSIIFENVYVSSNCFVDGAVCCDNASIKRNSAVFSGSVIGADALVGEDMTIENGAVINKNVRYDKFDFLRLKKNGIYSFGDMFQGLSPDKLVLLGSAFSVAFKKPKVIVGSDGAINSLSLKLAFISGLIASGSECLDVGVTFKSHVFFCSEFCDCDYSVFFSGLGGGTDVEFFDRENKNLSRTQCCNLLDALNSKEIKFNETEKRGNVRQIKGLKRMYIREITAFSDKELPFVSGVICGNKMLMKTAEEVFKECISKDFREKSLVLYMNESGTNVNIKFKGVIYRQKTLIKLVSYFMKKGEAVKVFESDIYKSLWKHDGIFLIMSVLNIVKKTEKELDVLIGELPRFFIKRKHIDLKCGNNDIAEKLSEKYKINHKNGSFKIKCNEGYIKLINNQEIGKIKILTAAESLAIAEELCDFFVGFLPQS